MTKKAHYISEMWNCKHFSEPGMLKRNSKPETRGTWARLTAYFKNKSVALKKSKLLNERSDRPKRSAVATVEMKQHLQLDIDVIETKGEKHILVMKKAMNCRNCKVRFWP